MFPEFNSLTDDELMIKLENLKKDAERLENYIIGSIFKPPKKDFESLDATKGEIFKIMDELERRKKTKIGNEWENIRVRTV